MNTSAEIQNHITHSVELIKLLEVLYRRKNTNRGLDTPWFGARLLLTRMKDSLTFVMGDVEKLLENLPEAASVTLYPSDAVHLLSLLETVTVQLAEGELSEEEIPWAGLQLTLAQTKEALMSVQASLVETRYEQQNIVAARVIPSAQPVAVLPNAAPVQTTAAEDSSEQSL